MQQFGFCELHKEQYGLLFIGAFLQNQNSNSTDWGFFIIILIVIITCIYFALYVPIKLYQINKNTKKINEELEKMNKNLYNIYKKDNQN